MKIQYFLYLSFILLITACEAEAPRCNDGFKNGDETEIDCGGSCPECYTCSDGFLNQDETDIDCGGPCEPCYNEWQPVVTVESGNSIYAWDFAPNGFGIIASRTSYIRKTYDGGQTWEDITLPHPWQYMEMIYVLDELNWYVQVNGWGVFVTNDGGQTWNTGTLQLRDMHFLDRNHGIMLLGGDVYTTNDGGVNWVFQVDVDNLDGNYEKIIRSSETHFHVITRYKLYRGQHNSTGGLYSQSLSQFDLSTNMIFKGEDGYALSNTNPILVKKTDNGGASWTTVSNNIDPIYGQITLMDYYNDDIVINTRESIYANQVTNPYFQQYTQGGISKDNGLSFQPLGLVNKNNDFYAIECAIVEDDCFCSSGRSIMKLHLPSLE